MLRWLSLTLSLIVTAHANPAEARLDNILVQQPFHPTNPLYTTVTNLWPSSAYRQLHQRNISIPYVQSLFHVIFPWDRSYNDYRVFFQTELSELPLFIIVLHEWNEATRILDFITHHNLQIRVITGRHSSSIQNPQVYVDVSYLHGVKYSVETNTLTVQGGTSQGQVYEYLFTHNLSVTFIGTKLHHPSLNMRLHHLADELGFPGGSAGSVGVAGLVTSGGLGTLKRSFGLACDHLTSVTLAVPPTQSNPSRIVTVSSTHHRDLWWALRGGLGSNFGIIVQMEFTPIEVPTTLVYSITFAPMEWDRIAGLLAYWQSTAPDRPTNFNEDFDIWCMVNTTGSTCHVGIAGVYVVKHNINQAYTEILSELCPYIHRFNGVLNVTVEPYSETMNKIADGRIYQPYSSGRIILSSHQLGNEIEQAFRRGLSIPGIHLLGIELLGGRISDVSAGETAFVSRHAQYMYDIFSYWDSSVYTCVNQEWVRSLFNAIYQPPHDHVYVGFPINQLHYHNDAYYGDNRLRLREVKRKWDPFSVLHFPTGIVQ